jgi:hypothetical protein
MNFRNRQFLGRVTRRVGVNKMSRVKRIALAVGVTGVLALPAVPAVPAAGGGDGDGNGNGKVPVCHATGSDTNPYVLINVSEQGAEAHIREHGPGTDRAERLGRADFIVTAGKKCPPEKKD